MRRILLSSLLSVCVLGSPSNIRLEGGRFPHEGNIMVNGQPVCDDHFTLVNADVACKELGYFGAVSFTQFSKYGQTSTDFAMDDVNCDGTEARLLDCPHTKKDNCGAAEGAGAVCDTVGLYRNINSDKCSVATPLYVPLRLAETHYKRFRDNVQRDSNRAADDLMRRMETSDREFRFRSSFRFPVDNEFDYKTAIADGSMYYSTYTEVFHSYISWGDFPWTKEFRRRRCYRFCPVSIAMAEKALDEAVSHLSEGRNRNRNQNIMKNVVKLIKPDTWPDLASCLYEAFKENQDSSTLSQVITDLVSEDDFEKFNRYFNYYVGSIGKSLKKVLESKDTIEMVQLIYELTKSEIKSIDYNSLQPTMDYFVLQLKTVLLKPDFNELYTTLNQAETFIQKSFWKLETGRWPEMATFVEHFLRRTIGSIVFWDRLTGQFLIEMKNKIPEMKKKIPDMNNVEKVDYFDELFELFMSMIADGDEDSIRQIFQDIRGSKWDETVTSYIEIIGKELTSCNLATLASYLPNYEDIKSTISHNHFFQPIKTLLFENWPQDEIYPASIEDFLRRIYDTRFSIFDAVFGDSPCDHDD